MKAVLHAFRQTVFLVGPGLSDKGRISPQYATRQSRYMGKIGFLEMDAGKAKYKNKKHLWVDSIGSFTARLSQEQIGLSQENEVIYLSLRRIY